VRPYTSNTISHFRNNNLQFWNQPMACSTLRDCLPSQAEGSLQWQLQPHPALYQVSLMRTDSTGHVVSVLKADHQSAAAGFGIRLHF
jgi:hypothetical protein